MRLSCPTCGNPSEVPDNALPPAGSSTSCPGCGQPLTFDGVRLVTSDHPPAPRAVAPASLQPDAAPAGNPLLPAALQADASDDAPSNPEVSAHSAEVAGAAASDRWHVRGPDGNAQPVSLLDLKDMIRSGKIGPTDPVFARGATDWSQAISQVSG